MAKYTDTSGKEWDIRLTVGVADRVRNETGIDLFFLRAGRFEQLEKLADPLILYQVAKIALGNAITDADAWNDSLDGDTLDRMGNALLQSIVDFCRDNQRPALLQIVEKMDRVQKNATKKIIAKVDQMPEDAEKIIEMSQAMESQAMEHPSKRKRARI
jgi:hypothetical protein